MMEDNNESNQEQQKKDIVAKIIIRPLTTKPEETSCNREKSCLCRAIIRNSCSRDGTRVVLFTARC